MINDDIEYLGSIYDQLTGHEEQRIRATVQTIEGHTARAVTRDPIDLILNKRGIICGSHRMTSEEMQRLNISLPIYDNPNHKNYQCIYNTIRASNKKSIDSYKIDLSNCYRAAFKSAKVQQDYVDFFVGKKTKSINEHLSFNVDNLLPYFRDKKIAEEIKDKICYKDPGRNMIKISDNLHCDSNAVYMKCHCNGEWTAFPVTMFMLALDTLQLRFTTLLRWRMCDSVKKFDLSIYENGLELISLFDKIQGIENKKFFTILKSFESLAIGSLVMREEDMSFKGLFQAGFDAFKGKTYDYGNKIVEIVKNLTVNCPKMLIELTGISKFFGAPWIDIKECFAAVKENSCKVTHIDQEVVEEGVCMFKKLATCGYYKKYKKYPPMENNSVLNQYAWHEDIPNNIFSKRVRESKSCEWKDLEFKTTFEFDSNVDVTSILKDSAIALELDEIFCRYDRCSFSKYNKKPPTMSEYQSAVGRLIYNFLTNKGGEIKSKLEELMRGIRHQKDNISGGTPKELELKELGRLFIQQTYRQRGAQVVREENIKKFFCPLFDGISMHLSGIQVKKKSEHMIKVLKDGGILMNIDFSKWNQLIRHVLVRPFGKIIDQMMDSGLLFQESHLHYLNTRTVPTERMCGPEFDSNNIPIPGEYCYTHQYGGNEGMQQKFWTLIMLSFIELVAEKHGLKIEVIAQGDNEVIIFRKQGDPDALKGRIENFAKDLSHLFSKIGLKIKLEETFLSKLFWNYGKENYLDGVHISNATKKCKMVPDQNDSINCEFT